MEISLVPNTAFVPTSAFSGEEPPTVIRGENCVIRAQSGRTKIENYLGSKNLSETYDIASESLTGTLSWSAGSDSVSGSGTAFTTALHVGQGLLVGTEPCFVRRIVSDTSFYADRVGQLGQSGVTARYLWTLQELNKQRWVIRRGSAFLRDRKDIIYCGDGTPYLNGSSLSVTATRRPKRLQRAVAGTYTDVAIGFDKVPRPPVVTASTGGWKGMLAGKYSFMFSFWNSVDDSYSNPCGVVKQDGGATDITIAAGGRFGLDLTTTLADMPSNADGIVIWGSQSGGGVTTTNDSNFASGAWSEVRRMRTTAYSVVDADVDPSTDQVTISGHKFRTADSIYVGGAAVAAGLVTGTEYFVIYVDANTIKFATTAANANAGTAIDITADPGGTMSVRSCKISDDTTFFEYLDAEMGGVASGNNNPPPDCEFVTEFANQMMCVSALGNATATKPLGTSPGAYVLTEKPGNRGGFPAEWRVSVGDEITGFANGVGRLFCLTANSMPFVTPTGRTELARLLPTGLDLPFTSRPFWTKGGVNPFNVIVVQGDVFVYTGRTLLRSPTNADQNVVPYEIGLPIADLTANWTDGHTFLGHCGKNQQICIISSGTRQNSAGYWVSEILPYSLQKNEWQPVITLSSSTADMIVSGVATVNGRMEFLAGGRKTGGAYEIRTYRYDENAGAAVAWYVAFQPSDIGEDQRLKRIKSFRVTAKTVTGIIQVHGAAVGDGEISLTDIAAGSNSISGNITVPASTGVEREGLIKREVTNLTNFTVRYADEWSGSGDNTSLHKLVLDVELHGGRF